MRSCEVGQSRNALAALLGFVVRGDVTGPVAPARTQQAPSELQRGDGASRKVDARLLALALERGLLAPAPVSGQVEERQAAARIYTVTPEGRAALRRWLADPESAFQDQHRSLISGSDPDHGRLTVNAAESPLAALARLKGRDGGLFLESCQVEAGERLRADFTRGHLQPSLGQRWDPVSGGRQGGMPGGASDLSESALSARLRVEAALAEVGPELSGVLLDVCCFLKRLSDIEHERQWPARSAKLMLRTALASLARHYRSPGRTIRPRPAPPPHAP